MSKLNLYHLLIILPLLLCFDGVLAGEKQELKVLDAKSKKPLEFVTIYNESERHFTQTDKNGRADISGFNTSDSIYLSMLGYKTAAFTFKGLEEYNFVVHLIPGELVLGEAVVSASRWERDRSDIPSRISTIQKQEIEIRNPQTSADLLAASGDVFIQKSQMGGGSPMIRGFATNRVLLNVDGVRMNNAIFRGGNIQNVISLNPQNIERTEVLFGPGAVMYGSDAIGGAMSFYTITPAFSPDDSMRFGGSAMTRYATANQEKTGHVDLHFGFEKWAFASSISYSEFGDLRMGSLGPEDYLRNEYQDRIEGVDTIIQNDDPELQKESAYNQLSFMQKIRYAPNDDWNLEYGFHYSTTSDIPRYDRLIEKRGDLLRDAEWYYGPQKWMMNAINATHYRYNLFYNSMRITLAHQVFEESRHNRSFNSDLKNHRTETVNAYSANIDFDKRLGQEATLTYGLEVVHNIIGSEAERRNIVSGEILPLSTRYPDGADWTSIGGYASYMNRFSEKLTLQAGLRYSHVLAKASFDTDFFPFPYSEASISTGAVTGSGGLAYRPTRNWQINLNLSTGFRAPNIDDMAKVFDSEPGAVMVPNPDLSSEYAYNAELGLTRNIADMLKIEITGFYTILQDALVRGEFQLDGRDSVLYDGEMSRVLAIQNAAEVNVYGIQSGIDFDLPLGLNLKSRFTWQKGEEELEDGSIAPLRHSVPWFGSTTLTYSKNRFNLNFSIDYQSAVAYSEMAPSEQAKTHLYAADEDGSPHSPQWTTFNLMTMYQLTDYLSINAGVENILDLRYRPYASGITAPGRNFIVSLRAQL